MAGALLLGRLPRLALAVLALTVVLGVLGLTITSSDRPQHPSTHEPRAAQ